RMRLGTSGQRAASAATRTVQSGVRRRQSGAATGARVYQRPARLLPAVPDMDAKNPGLLLADQSVTATSGSRGDDVDPRLRLQRLDLGPGVARHQHAPDALAHLLERRRRE